MIDKCKTCGEEIRMVSGRWMHYSLQKQIDGKYGIHKPEPLVKMVEEEGQYFKDI